MGEQSGNGIGKIGSNGHGGDPFRELDELTDDELERLVAGIDDEAELRALVGEAEDEATEPGEGRVPEDEAAAEPRRARRADEREIVGRRLYPDWEYVAGATPAEAEEPPLLAEGALAGIAEARRLLRPVELALRVAGYYAYGTLDDENRWTIAVDDEAGRIDVRLGHDGYLLDLRATSPGLFADVDHPFRRRRMERIVREALPRVARGYLEPHQAADWDEVDEGVAVCIRYVIPWGRAEEIGAIVRARLPELDDLLALVEERVTG